MYKLSILSNPRNLARVRKKIALIARKAGFVKKEIGNIVLAVDEACTNIIRHSYLGNHTKKININADIKNNQLKITLRHYGIKPDLKKVTGRRPRKIKPGGLGVYFIKKIVDKVIYDGKRLILIKKCKQ